jgi:mono/diheme cytochrome c family protein
MNITLRALPLFLALLAAAPAPQEAKPAPEKFSPGLILHLEGGGLQDARETRLAALYVPQGQAPSSVVPPGPFKAVWEGYISVDLGTDCSFSAAGNGSLSVTVADKPALQAKGTLSDAPEGASLRLRKGRNKLKVAYESPATGDAALRLYWSSADFTREPIPPAALSHNAAAAPLVARKQVREGRELVASRRCTKCHVTDLKGMPELDLDAPSLAEAGARLNPDWVARWILAPRQLRPEATMPKPAGLQAQDAADIAAYLATLGKPDAAPAASEDLAKAGGHLFVEMRCVGCHTLPDKDPAPDRIPFAYLKAKWTPAGLKKFLLGPEKHYAWIEMPNFHLSDEEAGKLAAFLLSRPGKDVEAMTVKGDPVRGKQQRSEERRVGKECR